MVLPRLATPSIQAVRHHALIRSCGSRGLNRSVPTLSRPGSLRAYAALLDPAHSVDFELPRIPKEAAEHIPPDMLQGGFEYHWHVQPRDQRPPITPNPTRRNSPNGATPFPPIPDPASSTPTTQAQAVEAQGIKAEPENREIPHAPGLYERTALDARLAYAARRVFSMAQERQLPNLKQLLNHFDRRAGFQLDFELPMEPTPVGERQTPLTSPLTSIQELRAAWDDGSMLVVYVSGGLDQVSPEADQQMRISVCSGFCIAGGEHVPRAPPTSTSSSSPSSSLEYAGQATKVQDDDRQGNEPQAGETRQEEERASSRGALFVTCAHALQNAFRVPLAARGTPAAQAGFMPHSVAFAISRQGAIYPIHQLVSSLPLSDLILYQLDPHPIVLEETPDPPEPLRTLPVSPYPAPVGTEVAVASFTGWGGDSGAALPDWPSASSLMMGGGGLADPTFNLEQGEESSGRKRVLLRRRNRAGRSRWGRAEVIKYRDECGAEAHTGTYDTLSQMEFKILPRSVHNPAVFRSKDAPGPPSDPGPLVAAVHPPAHVTKSRAVDQLDQQDMDEVDNTVNHLKGVNKGGEKGHTKRKQRYLPDFPPPGSSGGPVVDVSTGAVVGVVRSTKYGFLAGRHGDAIPAEHLFNLFALPGLGKKKSKTESQTSTMTDV